MKKIGFVLSLLLICICLIGCNSNVSDKDLKYTLLPENTWWDEQPAGELKIEKSEIKTISFVKSMPEATPVKQWNADVQKAGYVQCCIYGNADNYELCFVGNKIKANENSQMLFNMFDGLSSISFDVFDTSNVKNMFGMFAGCTSLISLDLSTFDTSEVTNMDYVFSLCSALKEIDLESFDTSKVTSMEGMFIYCKSLETLDLGNFHTSNVTNMSSMFSECENMKKLNLCSFDILKTTNVGNMFYLFGHKGSEVSINPQFEEYFNKTILGNTDFWTYLSGVYSCVETPKDTCTITFYDNTSILKVESVAYGSTFSSSKYIPQKDGYVFAGWYYDSECTEYYDDSQLVRKDINLYSKYIYGSSMGKIEANIILSELSLQKGDKVTAILYSGDNSIIRTKTISNDKVKSVVFDFCSVDKTGTIDVKVTSSDGITKGTASETVIFDNYLTYDILVLQEGSTYCKVSFDTNGGSVISNQVIKPGSFVCKPYPNPTKIDCMFVSWYTNSDFSGTAYDFNTPVTSDLTLYAKWKEEKTTEKWCVMNYFDFSNLQDYALFNLNEICCSCPNDNVKAYFLTGGSITSTNIEDYPNLAGAIQAFNPTDPFGSSSQADTYQFWEYTKDGKFVEISPVIKGMNNPDVLSDFIDQCYYLSKEDNPNADYKYILELWNHGGGSYVGLIRDNAIMVQKDEDCMMSLSKCANAIKKSTKNNNFKFEVVVFDMCLMQSIEIAHAVSYESTNYIIGSQTASAGTGSAYTDWFNFLYNHPQANGYEFGKVFCNTANNKIRNNGSSLFIENITWSVLDMSKFEKLEQTFESFVASDLSTVSTLEVDFVLETINSMPAFYNDGYMSFWDYYMYDINVFASLCGESQASLALISAVEDAIIYKKYGSLQENAQCGGLSMCILTDKNNWDSKFKYSSEWNNEYLNDCLSPNYRAFQKRICSKLQ